MSLTRVVSTVASLSTTKDGSGFDSSGKEVVLGTVVGVCVDVIFSPILLLFKMTLVVDVVTSSMERFSKEVSVELQAVRIQKYAIKHPV
ncbi:MAG: hypothetical protein CL430_02820 [Acidimicrobiaceae bacterium]|jgi:hypothetical protein|nr:hypothetical protein [Acidimicrobiaceae bacterium]MDP6894638.1 hypothetical protein [Acidimicrobiales bacterium]